MKKNDLIRQILILSNLLYKASLVNTEWANKLSNYLRDIKKNDLVYENSTGYNVKNACDKIGFVKEIYSSDHVKIKRLVNGKIITWENCQFIKIPQSYKEIFNL